jgi:hypothetical protein
LAPVFLQFLGVLSVLGGKIDTHLNGYVLTWRLGVLAVRCPWLAPAWPGQALGLMGPVDDAGVGAAAPAQRG